MQLALIDPGPPAEKCRSPDPSLPLPRKKTQGGLSYTTSVAQPVQIQDFVDVGYQSRSSAADPEKVITAQLERHFLSTQFNK